MGDCFTLFLYLIYLNTSCDKALNDTAVNGVLLKLHKRLVSIYKRVCLLPPPAPATTFLCQR